jgi:hypothetical protein
MRKRIISISSAILVLIFAVLFIYNSGTPDLTIYSENKQIQKVKPVYGWNTFLKHTGKDNRTPFEIAKSLNAINVKPGILLNLKFDRETENIDLSLWSEKEIKLLPSCYAIGVPESSGIYVYRVVGKWKQGTAIYIIKVNVN